MEQTVVFKPEHWGRWHRGIQRYGFWCVEIEAEDVLKRFARAQRYCEQWLIPGYQRQPHVTLAACGLVSEAHFSAKRLQEQREVLDCLALPSFQIAFSGLATFSTVPYVQVDDLEGGLRQLRAALIPACYEQDHPVYRPHLTLGFFQQVLGLQEVRQRLAAFDDSMPINYRVRALQYCEYATDAFQGRYEVRDSYVLRP